MTQLHAPPTAGWYADPSGRHEARYWDGQRWTDRVADRGVERLGPETAPAGPLAGDPPVVPDLPPAPLGHTGITPPPPPMPEAPAPAPELAAEPRVDFPVHSVDPVEPVEPVEQFAANGPEVGWYPDPAGRHEVRYWDGSRWTERVADNGVETTESATTDVLEVAADAIVAEPVGAEPIVPDVPPSWAPDWYPDPTGRHEVRYFDGMTWTEHVANNGLTAFDPIADGAPVAADAEALAATIVPAVSTAASPNATTVEAAHAAFAAALAPSTPVEEPEAPEQPEVLPVRRDWAARPNALVGWIVVIGAGILAVGSLGPWAKATAPVVGEVSQNGMSGDGRFMLAIAVLLIAAGIGLIVGRFGRVVAFSALSLGTLAAIVCAVDMARISNGNYGLLQGTVGATAAAGIGLWACLAGAIVCIAGGIVAVTHR